MPSASHAGKFPYRVDSEVSTKSPTQYILSVGAHKNERPANERVLYQKTKLI